MLDKLDEEQKEKDQDVRGMHVYNQWNGCGYSECLENLVSRLLVEEGVGIVLMCHGPS